MKLLERVVDFLESDLFGFILVLWVILGVALQMLRVAL